MRFLLGLILLFLLNLHGVAQNRPPSHPRGPGHEPVIHPLLTKVREVREKVRLSGIRVVQHLEQGERTLVTERILRDGVRIKTVVTDSGSQKGTEAVEDARKRLVWNPKTNEIRETGPREAEFFLRFGRMGRNRGKPQIKELDGGAIAGVPTKLLEFSSGQANPDLRVWIDPEHGVILKVQSFDPKGALNGSMEFTKIQFDPVFPNGTFELKKPGARFVTVSDELRRAAKELGMRPYRLPEGDQWKLVGVRKMTPKGVKVLMQTYFGPNARISLFQIEGEVDAEKLRKISGGGARSFVWTKAGTRLVLIGTLEGADLKRLSERVTG